MWQKLFDLVVNLVLPQEVEEFLLVSSVGFGREKDCKISWRSVVGAIIWCIWMLRNARILITTAHQSSY